jgi:hypothetical protein
MEYVVIWFLFGIACAVIASNQKRDGCGWFIAGVLLGPFGLIFLLITKTKAQVDQETAQKRGVAGDYKKCPKCAEVIRKEAVKCRFCQSDLEPLTAAPAIARKARPAVNRTSSTPWTNTEKAYVILGIFAAVAFLFYANQFFDRARPEAKSPLASAAFRQPAQGWRVIRTIGMNDIVVVDKAREADRELYLVAVEAVCASKPKFCRVMIYSDALDAPLTMSNMTDAEFNAMRASSLRNSMTGYRNMEWDCAIFPQKNKDDCLVRFKNGKSVFWK